MASNKCVVPGCGARVRKSSDGRGFRAGPVVFVVCEKHAPMVALGGSALGAALAAAAEVIITEKFPDLAARLQGQEVKNGDK